MGTYPHCTSSFDSKLYLIYSSKKKRENALAVGNLRVDTISISKPGIFIINENRMEKREKKRMKMTLILSTIFIQITAYVVMFYHITAGISLLLISYILLSLILFLSAQEKRKEKQEENWHDYRDY